MCQKVEFSMREQSRSGFQGKHCSRTRRGSEIQDATGKSM